MTGGKLVSKGKVMVGTTGLVDGGNSWNLLPRELRDGGFVWILGSYDPVTSLAFFGPGNTYGTAPF